MMVSPTMPSEGVTYADDGRQIVSIVARVGVSSAITNTRRRRVCIARVATMSIVRALIRGCFMHDGSWNHREFEIHSK